VGLNSWNRRSAGRTWKWSSDAERSRIDEGYVEATRIQDLVHGNPVGGHRLHRDRRHAAPLKPVGHGGSRSAAKDSKRRTGIGSRSGDRDVHAVSLKLMSPLSSVDQPTMFDVVIERIDRDPALRAGPAPPRRLD
jgi:hypothetical protein